MSVFTQWGRALRRLFAPGDRESAARPPTEGRISARDAWATRADAPPNYVRSYDEHRPPK